MRTSRRALIVAAGASLLPLHPTLAAALIATPSQTEGPFYPTALPADTDNDRRVLDLNGKPVEGALIEIWQCDAQGIYDHPRQPGRERRDSAFQGYGRMMAADGRYSFRTLRPVAYPGRTPHIHVKVATAGGGLLTSQFYIAGEPGNERDGIFRAAARDPRQRERIEMRLAPAPGLETGALATTMDIVVG